MKDILYVVDESGLGAVFLRVDSYQLISTEALTPAWLQRDILEVIFPVSLAVLTLTPNAVADGKPRISYGGAVVMA